MVRYCVDSDVIIDLLRGDKTVLGKIKAVLPHATLFITTITLCELFRGAYLTRDPEKEIAKIRVLIDSTLTVTLDKNSAMVFGLKSRELRDTGKQHEELDLMIASLCIANNLTLLTRNKKHFDDIPGLQAEFW